ncbi:uncharacterized protein CDV56_107902 [Aspergillus thermomutatus]|uniref:FAD-binding domain-containing protein n=1 Tax=Aspergillus thermomutatus TaxID=41047 RepID=A0A397H0M5_ASPTH|nr:uncharacterized protein CDV56_107902 [Aspergillus thermomutatus]RHZ55176.1 hypothetical protein CDV56_107902 [Aspergillus thermomutatus]
MSPSVTSEKVLEEVPILIIGGGPSGLLLAFMLSQLGGNPSIYLLDNAMPNAYCQVQSLIVERYPTRLAAPKAHALSPRSLEICRQFGLDVNEIRKIGTPRRDAYWVNFITSLDGKLVGRLPYERMDADVLDMIHNIPQPAFEEVVARRVSKSPLCEIRKNHSFVGLEQFDDHVLTTIEDRSLRREYIVKSRHVVACDGAKSAVRRFLGVESEGEDSYETMMTIHFNADLRPVVGDRVGMLHWVMDPEVSGFIIGYDLSGNQVLICNFDAERHPAESWNEELCRKIVDGAIGKGVKYDVLSYRPWVLSRKVANKYKINRVFLAGDAAHSFPPTGGLGLNSGLGDVHNLAYKLAAVHKGWAGDGLLESYEADRRHVAIVNSQQSVKNGLKIFGLLKKLGTTNKNVEIAREHLYRNLQDPQAVAEIEQGIEEQREHFDNLGLHIGYVYGDTGIPECASVFQPVCRPGARLPHAWIRILPSADVQLPPIDSSYVSELSAEQVKWKEYSALDLCAFDSSTIIVDSARSHQWGSYIEQLKEQLPAVIASTLSIRMLILGKDFELAPGAEGRRWIRLMGLEEGQAILIRPDQHILACFDSATAEVRDLLHTLQDHLAWSIE